MYAMTSIKESIQFFHNTLPENVRLIAVSKTHPEDLIREAIAAGQTDFGENKMQEMTAKNRALTGSGVRWHCIGHLQTNKVKDIAPFVHMIHSVDSFRLMQEIERQAVRCGRIIPCLLQVHIAMEETKFGFSEEELTAMLEREDWAGLQHLRICGLMGIATTGASVPQLRDEFGRLRQMQQFLKTRWFTDREDFKELSMGMSEDWETAVEEGSTMVRIGSLIFGRRNYAVNA